MLKKKQNAHNTRPEYCHKGFWIYCFFLLLQQINSKLTDSLPKVSPNLGYINNYDTVRIL